MLLLILYLQCNRYIYMSRFRKYIYQWVLSVWIYHVSGEFRYWRIFENIQHYSRIFWQYSKVGKCIICNAWISDSLEQITLQCKSPRMEMKFEFTVFSLSNLYYIDGSIYSKNTTRMYRLCNEDISLYINTYKMISNIYILSLI